MSDAEKRIQKMLSALEERMSKGEISRSNYEHLKNKFENRLTSLRKKDEPSGPPITERSPEDSIFKEVMDKVVSRVYACDYCGGALDVVAGVGKAKCPFCGYVNEVDYLRRVSERLRAERAQIIRGAMDSFARVTNLEQLKLPLHERFLATAHIYENRALRLEFDLGKIKKYGSRDFEDEKERYTRIEDKREYYEASKSWHQVAELYRNASEFATSSMEMESDLAASHYYDGLAFFDVGFAPIRLVKNTFSLKVSAPVLEQEPWPWSTGTKNCETLEDLLLLLQNMYNDWGWWDAPRGPSARLQVQNEIEKYAHPVLIRHESADTSLHSALKATNCFMKAYETSKEEKYLVYALLSKLLVYMLYVESLRESIVGPRISGNFERICSEELYVPSPNRTEDQIDEDCLNHADSLRSLVKKFAVFAISTFKDYVLGIKTEWREVTARTYWDHHRKRARLCLLNEFALNLDKFIDKIERVFGQKLASYTLKHEKKAFKIGYIMRQSEWVKTKNIGFKFSWVLGRNKTGLLSYDKPGFYLAIESSSNHKGVASAERFFDNYFTVFKRLAVYPDLLTKYSSKAYEEEMNLRISLIGDGFDLQLTPEQFLDLYYSLVVSFKKIKHHSTLSEQNNYGDRIKFVELWKNKTRELSKMSVPKILEATNERVLSPEFIRHDLDFISFFADIIPTFRIINRNKTVVSIKDVPSYDKVVSSMSEWIQSKFYVSKKELPNIYGDVTVEVARDKEGVCYFYPSLIDANANFADFVKVSLDSLDVGGTRDGTPFIGLGKTIINRKYVEGFVDCMKEVFGIPWVRIQTFVNKKTASPMFLTSGEVTMAVAPFLGERPKVEGKFNP